MTGQPDDAQPPSSEMYEPHDREARSSVFLRARLQTADGIRECRVRNLSEHGACVDYCDGLSETDWIPFSLGAADTRALVVWMTEDLAGLHFHTAIDLAAARQPNPSSGTTIGSGWLTDRPDPYGSTPPRG